MHIFFKVIGWWFVARGIFQLLLLFIFVTMVTKQSNTDPEKRSVMESKGLLLIVVLPSTASCLDIGLWLAVFR